MTKKNNDERRYYSCCFFAYRVLAEATVFIIFEKKLMRYAL